MECGHLQDGERDEGADEQPLLQLGGDDDDDDDDADDDANDASDKAADETNEPGPTKRTQETAIREWQESVGCAGLGLSRQDSAGDDEPDGAELPAEKRTRVDA